VTTILVADGDQHARWRTAAALRLGGYAVESARMMNEAGALLRRLQLDGLVLDPDADQPHEIVAELRARTDAPMIVVSARDGEREKVAGLDAGADDYVVKPFGVEELLARMRALLRRTRLQRDEPLVCTPHFTINLADRRFVLVNGTHVRLTPTEWKVIEFLVTRAGHLVGQTELLGAVWGPQALQKKDFIRVVMVSIRRKVEPDRHQPRYFITEPALGLRFDPKGKGRR
jgi:two-component system, OmpR family, KDP operon response regulator KdpE